MAGGGEGGTGRDRWLLTYADLITLLLAYFIVMFAISQTDLEKFEKLSASLRRAFNNVDLASVLESAGGGGEGFLDGLPAQNRDFVRISADLARLAQEKGLEGEISVNSRREGVVISISTSVLFDSGSAEIRPESEETLNTIANLLRGMPNEVRIAGHTDNISPYPKWPSNWELSAARAIQVVKYLANQGGLESRRLSAIGYGEQRPLFPNDTPEHRQKNRRVEILIVYDTSEQAESGPFGSAPPIEGLPLDNRRASESTPAAPTDR